jgi:sn-glycerol 3-phosphate transport system substrate-binding protein
MPFNISNPVLFYNKKMFAAAGLDPEKPPVSLDDLRTDSEAIVSSGAATYGLALDSGFDSGGGWYIEQWFAKAGEFYADNQNGRTARATKVLYNNAAGQSLLTSMQSLLNDGLAVNVGDNAGGIDNLLKLADNSQPAAMTIATSAAIGGVLTVLAGGQFPQISADDVGVGAMPGPGGKPGALVGGASLWVVDTGDDARTAAAWDFITYLTAAQQQSEWSAATGYVPVRTDALTLDPLSTTMATDPRFEVAYDQLLASPDVPTSVGPIVGPLREVRTVTAQGVAAIFNGADVASTLAASAAQADALIADYNSRNG